MPGRKLAVLRWPVKNVAALFSYSVSCEIFIKYYCYLPTVKMVVRSIVLPNMHENRGNLSWSYNTPPDAKNVTLIVKTGLQWVKYCDLPDAQRWPCKFCIARGTPNTNMASGWATSQMSHANLTLCASPELKIGKGFSFVEGLQHNPEWSACSVGRCLPL